MKIRSKGIILITGFFLFILLLTNCILQNNDEEAKGCNGKNIAICSLATISNTTNEGIYSIGGKITGLTKEGLVLQNVGVDDLSLPANSTSFTFPIRVSGVYSVSIKSQPMDKICSIKNGSGTATSDITNVSVFCCIRLGGSIQGCPLDLSQNVSTIVGTSGANGTTDGPPNNALFFYPYGIATDGINFYLADTFNFTIRRIVISTGEVSTLAGVPEKLGSLDGPGSSALFNYPGAVTTDGAFVYIADTYNYTVRKIEISNKVVTTIAGLAGVPGTADGIGTAARFNPPFGITHIGNHLYVTDGYNNTIRRINISTREVTTIAGTAGSTGSTNGAGSSALFNKPFGITTDGTNLYITDSNNNLIRKIEIATGMVTTIAGTGISGSADGIGTAAQFNKSTGITTDGSSLYIADTFNQTIRKLELQTGSVTTLAGTVRRTGDADGVGTAASFFFPFGITNNGTDLYIADTDNNTIRKISSKSDVQPKKIGIVNPDIHYTKFPRLEIF